MGLLAHNALMISLSAVLIRMGTSLVPGNDYRRKRWRQSAIMNVNDM
jgi:hypothetical protein